MKIGDKTFDSTEEPIMLILSKKDKENISNMHPDATKYCSFPEAVDSEEIFKFMEVERE